MIIAQLQQINRLFYQLAKEDKMDDASLWHDFCLIDEWYTTEFPIDM